MKALLIFAIWRGVYWGLTGGFFWSIGVLAAHLIAGERWHGVGGGVSLALLTGLVLITTRLRRLRAAIVPMSAGICGGIFAALLPARLWFGPGGMLLTGFLGFVLGIAASVPRSSVAVHGIPARFLLGAAAGAVVAPVGMLFPDGLGWTIAGALGGLVLGLPALYRAHGVAQPRETLEWTLCGAIAGALAGFSGLWLLEQALALPQPHPPLLGLRIDDKAMQWLYHALLWPASLFFIQLVSLAWRRRWRQRLRARQPPSAGVDAGHGVSGASKAPR